MSHIRSISSATQSLRNLIKPTVPTSHRSLCTTVTSGFFCTQPKPNTTGASTLKTKSSSYSTVTETEGKIFPISVPSNYHFKYKWQGRDLNPIFHKLRTYTHPANTDRITLSLHPTNQRIAQLTISNPSTKNALTGRMMTDLALAVRTLRSDPHFKQTLAVTIYGGHEGEGDLVDSKGGKGKGNGFCSGADLTVLSESRNFSVDDGYNMCYFMQHTLHELRSLPQVVVAVIDRFAVGGGTELALACDYRVMTEGGKFHMVQARMGLSTGWGGATKLVKLVGRRQALKLLAGSLPLKAEECVEIGLIDAIIPSKSIEEDRASSEKVVLDLLEPFLSQKYVDSTQACKKVINVCDELGDSVEAMAYEAEMFKNLWMAESNLDALKNVNERKQT